MAGRGGHIAQLLLGSFLFIAMVGGVGGQTPQDDDDVLLAGCPIVAREVIELTLYFEGHTGFTFTESLQIAVRDALVEQLSDVGLPDRRFLGIKGSSSLCETGNVEGRRRLLHKPVCTMLALRVFVPELDLVGDIIEVIRGEDFCREAELALHDGNVHTACSVGEVLTTMSYPKANPWGITAEAIFFLGIFAGTVLAVLVTVLIWQLNHRLGFNWFASNRQEQEQQPYQAAVGRPVLHVLSTNSGLRMLCKRSSSEDPPHNPLDEPDLIASCESLCESPDTSSGEHFMIRELPMSSFHRHSGQIMLMSMYFEEILTKSNPINASSPRYAQVKTRVLHRKIKVREADVVQDGSNQDPAFLLRVGSKYILAIEVRKETRNMDPFPFACLDHVVVVPPDGTPQVLPLVTLSSGTSSGKLSQDLSRHRVAALWDPCQHASQALFKATPDGLSLPLDITVVFRVIGPSEVLSYVQKTLKVRLREQGKAHSSDTPYTRPFFAYEKLPVWAKPFAKGGTMLLRAAKQTQSSLDREQEDRPCSSGVALGTW